jgi:competence protein ComGC
MTFRKQLDSNGFSALEVLVVVMIASFIIIVGLIVVIVGKSSPSKPKTNQAPASTVLSGAYAGWDTYNALQ